MLNFQKEISIDFLKKDHQMIHYFGLGFIQVKMDEHVRYHFYHPDLNTLVNEPHDHKYSFVCQVHKGMIKHTIYQMVEEGWNPRRWDISRNVHYELCTAEEIPSGIFKIEKKKFRVLGEFCVHEGSGYYMNKDDFQTVEAQGITVTQVIRREAREKDLVRVLRENNSKKIYSFSKKISEDKLWEIIEDCLR